MKEIDTVVSSSKAEKEKENSQKFIQKKCDFCAKEKLWLNQEVEGMKGTNRFIKPF